MSAPTQCVACGMLMYTSPPITDELCDKCQENKELKEELIRAYKNRGEMYWAGEKEWNDRRVKELEDELKTNYA